MNKWTVLLNNIGSITALLAALYNAYKGREQKASFYLLLAVLCEVRLIGARP